MIHMIKKEAEVFLRGVAEGKGQAFETVFATVLSQNWKAGPAVLTVVTQAPAIVMGYDGTGQTVVVSRHDHPDSKRFAQWKHPRGNQWVEFVNMDDIRTGRIGLMAATLGFCVFIERLGFTLSTFLFLLISMTILAKGRRFGLILGLSTMISLIGWAVFIWAFDTRFPRGWFETTMKAVLSNG